MKDKKAGRPLIITVLCVCGFMGCFFKTILVMAPVVQVHGRWYAVYFSLSAVFMVFCLFELWQMKKTGFWGFLIYFVMNTGVDWGMGLLNFKNVLTNPHDFASFALVPFILLSGLIYHRRLS
jgi:hypothetical protein